MAATTKNALAVHDNIDDAFAHLQTAERALQVAVDHARVDFAHNSDKLDIIHNSLKLVMSALGPEQFVWRDYARARATSP